MSLFPIKMINTKVQIFNCQILAYYYFDTLSSLLIISRCTDIFVQRTKHTIDDRCNKQYTFISQIYRRSLIP